MNTTDSNEQQGEALERCVNCGLEIARFGSVWYHVEMAKRTPNDSVRCGLYAIPASRSRAVSAAPADENWIAIGDARPDEREEVLLYRPSDLYCKFWVGYINGNPAVDYAWITAKGEMPLGEFTHWKRLRDPAATTSSPAASSSPAEPVQPESEQRCEHGILQSMECLSCPPQEYVATTPPALPSESVMKAAEEIREWIGLSGFVDGEGLNEVTAIISKHFPTAAIKAGGDEEGEPLARFPRLPFICGKCSVQQHADGICANCGADALRTQPTAAPATADISVSVAHVIPVGHEYSVSIGTREAGIGIRMFDRLTDAKAMCEAINKGVAAALRTPVEEE